MRADHSISVAIPPPLAPNPPSKRRLSISIAEIAIVGVVLGLLVLLVAPRLTSAANADSEPALRDGLARLRTQIAIYQFEHHGVAPGYPNGNTTMMPTHESLTDQLTRYSDAQGVTSDTPSEEFKFGPYITSIPTNPLKKNADFRFVSSLERSPTASGEQGWIYQPVTGWIAANSPGTDIFNVNYADY